MFDGVALGILLWLSILFTWRHLPAPIKHFFRTHPAISDITTGMIAFFLLTSISKSIVAVTGSIVAGLLMNFTLTMDKWNKEDNDN
jgi:hypothetical protein